MKRLLTKQDREAVRNSTINFLRQYGGHEQQVYDIIFVKYEMAGKLCVQVWKSGAAHSYGHYSFRDEARRQAYIDKEINYAEQRAARKARQKLEQNNITADVKPGQVFYASWGYDQTNIDFYKVQSVKGCFAWLVPVGQKIVEGCGFMSERVVADPDNETGKPIKKKILASLYSGEVVPQFKIESFAWARPWDGESLVQSHYA